MTKRLVASLLVLLALASSSGVASAQSPDYPPDTVGATAQCPEVTVTGDLPPGETGTITVECETIVFGDVLSGTFGPLSLPETEAQGNGFVTFTVNVPSDFDTDRTYVLGLVNERGESIGNESVYVAEDGTLVEPSAQQAPPAAGPGRLVRTGSDPNVPVKAGLGLIAVGGLAVLTVRKRRQDAVTAS